MLKTCHIIVTHMHAVVQFVTHSWSCLILSQQRNSPAQQPWGENRHRFYSSSHNVIRAKHEEHASISCFWSCGIWCPRENHIRWTLIISVSPSSTHPFLTNVSGCFVVQKMGVSPSKFTSMAKWLFGASRWTTWPSNMSKKSCHAMICGDHRQSFKKIISAFSAPTQAKLEVAGLVNVL